MLDRLLYRFGVHTFIVCFHDGDWLRRQALPQVPPYQFRWATTEEVLAAADGSRDWLEPKAAAAALAGAERCLGAFLDGQMMACTWIARSGGLCRGMAIQVGPASAYGHEAKTRPGHRGKGLYASVVLCAARAVADAGLQMVGYVYLGNTHAVSGSARMGPMRRGVILCREGAHPWSWVSPLCRREGVSVIRTEVGQAA